MGTDTVHTGGTAIPIAATLGPASLNPAVLAGLTERGVSLLRLELSHLALASLTETLDLVAAHAGVPVCLDTEGAQARCGLVAHGVTLQAGQPVRLTSEKVVGTERRISLRPAAVFGTLSSHASVSIDEALLRIAYAEPGGAMAVVAQSGRVRSNRPVIVDPLPALPALTAKDRKAITVAAGRGVNDFGLSFAGSAGAVAELRKLAPPGARVTARIEGRAGVWNWPEIMEAADAVVVDRAHLARELELESVLFYQKAITRQGRREDTPVWVAIHRVASVPSTPPAVVAEANDIAGLVLDGAAGLVLTAETALSARPLDVVDRLARRVAALERTVVRLPVATGPSPVLAPLR